MTTRFTRLSVVSDDRQIDASLPAGRLVGDLLPDLAQLFSLPVTSPPSVLALSLPSSGVLGTDRTLDDAGVLDGQILYLTAESDAAERPTLDDVLSEVRGRVSRTQTLWSGADRDHATTLLAALGYAAAALSILAYPSGRDGALVAFGLALIGVGLTRPLWARWGAVLGGLALVPAALGTFRILAGRELDVRLVAVVGAIALTGAAVALCGRTPHLTVALAGSVVAVAAAGTAIDLAANASASAIAAWSVPALVLGLGVVPQLAAGRSGLLSLVAAAESGDSVAREQVRRDLDHARSAVDGALVALAVLGAAAAGTLIATGRLWAAVLGGLTALLYLLRTRAFTGARHVATLLCVPVAALISAGFTVPRWIGLGGLPHAATATGALVGAMLVVAGCGYWRVGEVAAARLSRIWDRVDMLAVLAVIPLVLLAQDVFAVIADKL